MCRKSLTRGEKNKANRKEAQFDPVLETKIILIQKKGDLKNNKNERGVVEGGMNLESKKRDSGESENGKEGQNGKNAKTACGEDSETEQCSLLL